MTDSEIDQQGQPENEVLRETRLAKEARERAGGDGQAKRAGWKAAAAAGLGIGSAALIAALLYTRKDKSGD